MSSSGIGILAILFSRVEVKRACLVVTIYTSQSAFDTAAFAASITPGYHSFGASHPSKSSSIHLSRVVPKRSTMSARSHCHLAIYSGRNLPQLFSSSSGVASFSFSSRSRSMFSYPVSTTGRTIRISSNNRSFSSCPTPSKTSGHNSTEAFHAERLLSGQLSHRTPSKSNARRERDADILVTMRLVVDRLCCFDASWLSFFETRRDEDDPKATATSRCWRAFAARATGRLVNAHAFGETEKTTREVACTVQGMTLRSGNRCSW
mmetsp:Transcript_22994/g.50421  ORF Transcript_22994/g.50421 Transcript_22994/m.50421 type:complete len:263 (+) Transcript_22994:566-1354(+)